MAKDNFKPSVCGVGYLGDGIYTVTEHSTKHNRATPTLEYRKWSGIISRCYNENLRHKYPSYENVTVCDKWHNFQTFAVWFNEKMMDGYSNYHIDKDLKSYNTKIYSPETCCLIPEKLNYQLVSLNNKGMYWDKQHNRWRSQGSDNNNKNIHLGYFDNDGDAREAYLDYKVPLVIGWLKDWKDSICSDTFIALHTKINSWLIKNNRCCIV